MYSGWVKYKNLEFFFSVHIETLPSSRIHTQRNRNSFIFFDVFHPHAVCIHTSTYTNARTCTKLSSCARMPNCFARNSFWWWLLCNVYVCMRALKCTHVMAKFYYLQTLEHPFTFLLDSYFNFGFSPIRCRLQRNDDFSFKFV